MPLLCLLLFWACNSQPVLESTDPPTTSPESTTASPPAEPAMGANGLPRNHMPPRPFHQPTNEALLPVLEATRSGDAQTALALLEPLLDGQPDDLEVAFFMGRALILKQDFENAVPHLERAVAAQPAIAQAHKELAGAYLSVRNMAGAEAQIDTYLTLVPTDAEAWFMRSFCRKYRGDVHGALADVEQACELEMEKACRISLFLKERMDDADTPSEATPQPAP